MTRPVWQPDGWGRLARIGLIAPHADLVPDAELAAMAPDGVTVHTTRVYFGAMATDPNLVGPVELQALRAYVEPPALDQAAGLLAGASLSLIAYAFTSTSYLGGLGDDEALRARLERGTNGIPVVTTCAAAVESMRALGVQRMALAHPPWITGELNELGANWFRRHGFDVVMASPAGIPGGQIDVEPRALYDWTRRTVPEQADVVFFGGNGFRVISLIDRLEESLGRPVLSANQVLLWAALRAAGVSTTAVTGYGRVFQLDHHINKPATVDT